MAGTSKTIIIEALFDERWDKKGRRLKQNLVTLEDVEAAIRIFNKRHPDSKMSTKNPANFFKDFIRNRKSANRNWPPSVLARGYTAKQVTGEGQSFRFIPIEPGQLEAFPSHILPGPSKSTPRYAVESVSMPLASRKLGRNDETWLIQVIARLRIVESHFSVLSKREIRQVDLLQLSVKLHRTEIDALFLAQEELPSGDHRDVLITCEAKTGSDDILPDQILEQVHAAFKLRNVSHDIVIPIAAKCLGPSEIHLIEFEAIERKGFESAGLSVASEAVYVVKPPVPGLCGDRRRL